MLLAVRENFVQLWCRVSIRPRLASMPPDPEPPVPPPRPINWDRVLQWSAAGIVVVTILGIASRRRSLLIAAELIVLSWLIH